jgi:hypothetical protein
LSDNAFVAVTAGGVLSGRARYVMRIASLALFITTKSVVQEHVLRTTVKTGTTYRRCLDIVKLPNGMRLSCGAELE